MKKGNKNIFLICLSIGLIAGCLFIVKHSFFGHPLKQVIPAAIKMKIFQGDNPPFNFIFEYPETWEVKTQRYKEKFDMVGVLGSQEPKTRFSVSMFVTKKSAQPEITASEMAEEFLNKQKSFSEFKILRKQEQKTSFGKIFYVDYQHTEKLPLYHSERLKTIIKEKAAFLIRNNYSYKIVFSGTEEQYKVYLLIFNHFLETFKFTD